MSDLHQLLASRLDGSLAAVASLRRHLPTIVAIAEQIRTSLAHGGLLATCGNGGSAAEAMHLAEELIGRYRGHRAPMKAICLNADPTALTCIANDFGFEAVFARQCHALLKRGDVLVVFSTSGNSANIVQAINAANSSGVTTIGLLGRDGGACAPLCTHAVIVDADESAHIQEAHQVILHMICESVETDLA